MTPCVSSRPGSSPRFRLLLALGLAAIVAVPGSRAQDPAPARDEVTVDPNPSRAATLQERARERADRARRETESGTMTRRAREAEGKALAEQSRREAESQARRAREAELKALAEQIRQRNEAIENEATREERDDDARRREAESDRARRVAEAGNRLAEIALLDLRIETTKDALKAVWKRIMEIELQMDLQGRDPGASRDTESLAILQSRARAYEERLREAIIRKGELEQQAMEAEQRLGRSHSRLDPILRGSTTTDSVARSVDHLLNRLNEEGAIDDEDHRQLNNVAGAIEELLNLFRDSDHGHDHDEPHHPDHD